jgi:hypothetical protein
MLQYTYSTPVGLVDLKIERVDGKKIVPTLTYSPRVFMAFDTNKEVGCGFLRQQMDLVFSTVMSQAAGGIDVSTPRYRNWVYNTVQAHTEGMVWGRGRL